MHPVRLIALVGCLAALCPRAGAEERNYWPIGVTQVDDDDGHAISSEHLGPIIFTHPAKDEPGGTTSGARPFFTQTKDATGLTTKVTVLYPLYIYRADTEAYRSTIFNLINWGGPVTNGPLTTADQAKAFDVWPFYFSRETGSPETSYHALFPVAGTIKGRLGRDEISWVLWPLYLRTEKKGLITTSTPWPFIQTMKGSQQGFALWPLYGRHGNKDTGELHSFFLWPLIYNHTLPADEFAENGNEPTRQYGFLPFYAVEKNAGLKNETYVWPLFGHSERTLPYRYTETRYFWPFLVQGKGDIQMINRWGPIYTHSVIKGVDKKWYLWPFVKQVKWEDAGLAQKKTQFLYLLYWSHRQQSLTNPLAAPADRTHVWPLFSKWDNGAGKKQVQVISPFDVLIPMSNDWRETWTPFFAIYRYDQRTPQDKNWSLLWGLATWHNTNGTKAFHLGPLFSVQSQPQTRRVAFGTGLFGWKREAGDKRSHWFWFDFPRKANKLPPPST